MSDDHDSYAGLQHLRRQHRKQRINHMVQPRNLDGDYMHKGKIRGDLFDRTLNGYQLAAQTTAIYPGKGTFWGLTYVTIKGGGEVGEFSEKVGKLMRDDGMEPGDSYHRIPKDKFEALVKEIGDELWYLAAKCTELGITLEDAALLNIEKLQSRQRNGTLSGSGDDR